MKVKRLIIVGLIGGFVFYCSGCKPRQEKKISQESVKVDVNKPEPAKATAKYYQKILQIDPKTAGDYMSIGFAHYYFGRIQEAKNNYEKAKKLYQAHQDFESVQEVDKYLGLLLEKER